MVDYIALGCSIVAFALYYNTLDAGFVYDDSRAILTNRDVLPTTPLNRLFSNDFWGTPLTHSGSHKSYRPIAVLSFRLNHMISGFKPAPYHLVNVVLHALTTALFVRTCRVLLSTPVSKRTAAFLPTKPSLFSRFRSALPSDPSPTRSYFPPSSSSSAYSSLASSSSSSSSSSCSSQCSCCDGAAPTILGCASKLLRKIFSCMRPVPSPPSPAGRFPSRHHNQQTQSPPPQAHKERDKAPPWFPVALAGLLFASHPIHSEAVAGLVGRADLGSALFFLLSFLSYVSHVRFRDTLEALSGDSERHAVDAGKFSKAVNGGPYAKSNGVVVENGVSRGNGCVVVNRSEEDRCADGMDGTCPESVAGGCGLRRRKWLWLGASVLFATLSVFTKEQGVTVIPLCAVYDVLLHLKCGNHCGGFHALLHFFTKRRRRTVCESLLVLGAALAFILHLRLAVVTGGLSSAAPRFAAADNPAAAPSSGPLTRLLTFAFLPAFNFGLLLLPRRLSFDWSMDAVPRLSSLGDPRNVVSLFFYAALFRIAIRSASRLARSKQQSSLQKIQRPYRRPPRTHRQGHRGPCNGTLPLTANACSSCKGSVLHYHQRCLGNNNNNNHLVSSGTKHISSQTIPTESAPCCTCCCPMLVLGPRRLRRCVSLASQESPPVPHQSLGPSELVLVSLAMLALPFLPASNLFFHVGFVVAERVLYLPSAGYCLLVAIGAKAVWGRFVRTRALRLVLLCGVLVLLVSMGARTVRRNRDWQDEESLYRSGISVNPPKAYGNLGNVLSSQGRIVEAEWAYKMALKYRSNMADVHYNLGILLQGKERYEEALQSYRRAIHFRPRLALAHLSLGQTLEKLGRSDEAAESYSRASRLDGAGLRDPEAHAAARASALSHLGRLRADGGRLHDAVALYHQAIRHMPPDYYQAQSLYNMLGEAHYLLREYAEAERWYKAALQVKPDHVPAHLTYGKMLAKNKTRLMEAEQWFLRAKELAPNDSSVFQHFGQFLSELERHVEAAEAWVRAVELAPSEHQMAFNAASALRQAGDNARAEEYYRRAVELSPLDPRSHMNLGAMLHVNGKYREAETAYREALRLRPGDETTLTNLRRLYSLLARLQARANCTTEAQKRPKEEPASEERSKPEESKGDWSAAAATAVTSTGQ